jgi:hypothetical protein
LRILTGSEYFTLDPLPPIKTFDKISKEKMYSEFKEYFLQMLKEPNAFDGIEYFKEIEKVKESLVNNQLEKSAKDLDKLKSRLYADIVEDFNKNKKYIMEDLEFSIASRALPDRLLLQKTVLADPQVKSAVDILKDPDIYYGKLYPGYSVIN